MTMKPFDLEKALAGHPVVLDGEPVTMGGYNQNAIEGQQVIFWNQHGTAHCANKSGVTFIGSQLQMAPTERKEWIVKFPNKCGWVTGLYQNFCEANDAAKGHIGATIHEITIVE